MNYCEYVDIISECIEKHMCMWNIVKDEEIKTFTIIGPNFTDLEPLRLFGLLEEQGYTIQVDAVSIFSMSKGEILKKFEKYGYTYEEPDVMLKRLLEKI